MSPVKLVSIFSLLSSVLRNDFFMFSIPLFLCTEPDVRSSIAWSQHLDPIFANNLERDAALSWQYFGSSTGFLRRFPGTQWPHAGATDNKPINDFRIEDWFIQAASSPKDIVSAITFTKEWEEKKIQLIHTTFIFFVAITKFPHIVSFVSFFFIAAQMILLDASGSMSGKSFELAIKTVYAILDTLSDNDFVNLIAFSDTTRSVVPCFKDKMVISCRHLQSSHTIFCNVLLLTLRAERFAHKI